MTTSSRLGGEGHHGAHAWQRWFTAPGERAHLNLSPLADEGEALPADPLEIQPDDVGTRFLN